MKALFIQKIENFQALTEADHTVLSLRDPVLSDLDVKASCKAEMQVFAHSPAELLCISGGAEKGPWILQLDLVLTDTIRFHFTTQEALGKPPEKQLKFLLSCWCSQLTWKEPGR